MGQGVDLAHVEVCMTEKMWGSEPFWGLGYEWDPDWVYTDRQKELRAKLIELCETDLRSNAKRFDDELMFPGPIWRSWVSTGSWRSPSPKSTAAWERTTSPTRWCARRSLGTGAHRPPCAT